MIICLGLASFQDCHCLLAFRWCFGSVLIMEIIEGISHYPLGTEYMTCPCLTIQCWALCHFTWWPYFIKIPQRCHSLYILQIYPLIADICLCLDFQICKITVPALIFRDEPCFPSVSKRYCWRIHLTQLNQKALDGLHVHYVWRIDVFHNHL